MTEHEWPTAEVIKARWVPEDRQPLSMHPEIFIRCPNGDYRSAPYFYFYSCAPVRGILKR
ncbi:hypothetical protein ABZS16_04195 [Trueperella pyogenes]|uniref:hypothetical protein n=1 Tax=Trueperella pyogenes TaxID=1661 RepID=UPI00339D3890